MKKRASTMEAFRVPILNSNWSSGMFMQTYGAIKWSCTVVRDLADICFYSYPLFLKELRDFACIEWYLAIPFPIFDVTFLIYRIWELDLNFILIFWLLLLHVNGYSSLWFLTFDLGIQVFFSFPLFWPGAVCLSY